MGRGVPWWVWAIALFLAFGGLGSGCMGNAGHYSIGGMGLRGFGRFGSLPSLLVIGIAVVALGFGLWLLMERSFWHKYFGDKDKKE